MSRRYTRHDEVRMLQNMFIVHWESILGKCRVSWFWQDGVTVSREPSAYAFNRLVTPFIHDCTYLKKRILTDN